MVQSDVTFLLQAVSELPVSVVGALLVSVAILGGWLAGVRYRQPGFLLPAIGALVTTGLMIASQPYVPPPKPAVSEPKDYTSQADFRTRWLRDRTLWGNPIGTCGTNTDGLLQCPFTFGIMESHPEITGEWQVMPVNSGLILMARRNVPEVANPPVPAPIQAYVADLKMKGTDTLYFLGNPRSDPVRDGDRTCQYWDKAILCFPTTVMDDAGDPGAVRREPVGGLVYQLSQVGEDPQNPTQWTELRLILLKVSLVLLAITGLPILVPGLRRRSFGLPSID